MTRKTASPHRHNLTFQSPQNDLTLEFLKFVLSKEGQEVVVKDGYYPMPAEIVTEVIGELAK